jgi:pyocin large subunit-like protein
MISARKMKSTVSYLLLILSLASCLVGCSARRATEAASNGNATTSVQASTAQPAPSVGFASRERLLEHYHKHGGEFGKISIEEYLRAAQTLRDHSLGSAIVEAVRTDGVITRFDRETGTFIAFDRDGIIRTCFRPNDGEAYFRRQLKRRD